ncbi:DUF4347 domain-containing protein [Pseudoalteromonas sp. T1lg76]|uniref:DUF4347 domain-containing protein n=1 Tax=Pseudoalteromonas sp. T1lg76 TaxID=2077103 RepID=UPI000CF6519A|nr:DUF4347 domain-containing protein [Pseudoalteromonas sp. T1lg76]
MHHFKLNKAAALLMPLGLSALPTLAGAYGGYIRTQQQRHTPLASHTLGQERHRAFNASKMPSNKKPLSPADLSLMQGTKTASPTALPNHSGIELKAGQLSQEVMIIDASLPDKSTFYKALKPGIEVIEIDDQTPIFAQLNSKLAAYKSLDALHWVSHGSQGKIHVGQQQISAASLNDYVADIKRLGTKLSAGADIRFYNCNLAQGEQGIEFIELLSAHTGADIAASNDLTGASDKGGDWQLEIVQGDIDSESPFDALTLQDFSDVLATYVADDFCPDELPTNGECGTTETSANGNLVASGPSGTYIHQYSTTQSLYTLSYPAPPTATGHIEFTKSASYTNFNLNSLKLDVYNSCRIEVTNNSGSTIYASTEFTTGQHTLNLGGNTTNISSFRVTGTNCVPNSTSFGVIEFNTTPYNSAPSIANLNGDSLNTYPGSATLLDQGSNATVSDADSSDFSGGNLSATITSGEDAAEDLLSVDTSGAVSLSGPTAGSNLSVSGTVIGTLANNIAAGNDFTANFNANATPARVQTLLRALNYENTDSVSPTTGARNVRVTINDGDGGTSANQDITVTVLAANSDGNLSAADGVIEPVALSTTVDTSGEAVNLFDFTLSDGGGGDNLAMAVSAIRVQVAGTSSDPERDKVTWRLSGPDANNVTGVYNALADVITFSGLNISIADGDNETYTINGYFNNNTNLTEKHAYLLSIDGDTDVTLGAGTRMGATSLINNGTGSPIEVLATQLRFSTQPAGSVSGSALMTQPVVTASDAFGNTDTDFSETITLSEGSAGVLTNASASASSGIATFSGLTYTATADQQAFTLTANDQDGVGSDLPSVNANAVIADVVATKLVFSTEPAPTSIPAWQSTSFTTVPVVQAVDAINVVDQGYSTSITLAEVNGPGTAIMTATGDIDGNASTVSITPSSGSATFTNLQLTYSPAGADSEVFNLQASSGGLATANSTALTALDTIPPRVTGITLVGTPPANATQISYLVSFDSQVQNISSDDFALTTLSGDASGTLAMVSASSGSSVTVTVNNMAGSGTYAWT